MKLIRTIHPEVKILDPAAGIVEYIASDETLDSYREVIRADGWRFTNFRKNAPFVDSHDYTTIEKCLGKVVDFAISNLKSQISNPSRPCLVETVQWAIDVPENKLAQIGWKMTQAGYLKAVSVGFYPVSTITPADGRDWTSALADLGMQDADPPPRCIYTQCEQVELSCCIIGANPNALAKCYKAGVLTDGDLDVVCNHVVNDFGKHRSPAQSAYDPGLADWACDQDRRMFLRNLERCLRHTEKNETANKR